MNMNSKTGIGMLVGVVLFCGYVLAVFMIRVGSHSESESLTRYDSARGCVMYDQGFQRNPDDTGDPLTETCPDSPVKASWVWTSSDETYKCTMYPEGWTNNTDPNANRTADYPVCVTSPLHPEFDYLVPRN